MEKHSWILKNLNGGIGLFPLFFCAIIEKARNVPFTTANRGEWVTVFRGKRKAVLLRFLVKTAEINGKFIFAKGFALVRVPVLSNTIRFVWHRVSSTLPPLMRIPFLDAAPIPAK